MTKFENVVAEKLISYLLHYDVIERYGSGEARKEAGALFRVLKDLLIEIDEDTDCKLNLLGMYRVEFVNFVISLKGKDYFDSLALKV